MFYKSRSKIIENYFLLFFANKIEGKLITVIEDMKPFTVLLHLLVSNCDFFFEKGI